MIQKVKLITREGKKVMGYRVTVTSDFHSNIENIWDKIQDIDTLREICNLKLVLLLVMILLYSGKKAKLLFSKCTCMAFCQ